MYLHYIASNLNLQGTPGLLQTLAVFVAEKVNMKKLPTTSIMRYAFITMLMDAKTF